MNTPESRERKVFHRRAAARTVFFYVLFACLWIYFSDTILAWFVSSPGQLTRAQTIKGWLFVLCTATLLYLYLGHCMRHLRDREESLEAESEAARQKALDQLQQLNTLFDSLGAVVYVADVKSYELIYVNRFAEEAFGPGWQGSKCFHYLQQGIDRPCAFCTNPLLLAQGEAGASVTWEFLNTKNRRWYECYDKMVRWPDGRLVRLEVAMDITERKELEKIKDDLLSSVSHEMRTPLTAIAGFAELLANDEEMAATHRRHVEIIQSEAEKLHDLVNNFLDVRRLKTDRARINYEHHQVRDILEKARSGARDCREHHDIRIECPPGTLLYGNRQELTQVVTQLLTNACRYSPKGGEITLAALAADGETSIRISDQGIGIPRHELDAIFHPFHKLDTGDRRTTKGIGLGLSLAREIVVLHGGQILVDSEPGRGSTFTVILPLPAVEPGPAATAATSAP